MSDTPAVGVMLVALAGAMSGTFSVPMKFTHRWEWENFWGLGSLFALVSGLAFAFSALPDILDIYRGSATGTLAATFLFGAGWGAGAIFFGLGVAYLGVGLGITLILGLTAIVGSIAPLMIQHPERILLPAGLSLIIGLILMLLGLGLLGLAGHKRDADSGKASVQAGKPFLRGLLFCIASGLLSPLVNFALAFGAPLIRMAAVRHGSGLAASSAPWALAFGGCFGLNVFYCGYLAAVRRTAGRFIIHGTAIYWAGALVMGVLWVGAMVVYGWGASKIGDWGLYLGFPLFMISTIVFANVWGAGIGEWRATSSRTRTILFLGLAVLVIAFAIFGWASKLIGGS